MEITGFGSNINAGSLSSVKGNNDNQVVNKSSEAVTLSKNAQQQIKELSTPNSFLIPSFENIGSTDHAPAAQRGGRGTSGIEMLEKAINDLKSSTAHRAFPPPKTDIDLYV